MRASGATLGGLFAFALWAASFAPLLYCGSQVPDLSVRVESFALDPENRVRLRGFVDPPHLRARARLTLDGATLPTAIDRAAGAFDTGPLPLSAGPHTVCVALEHGGARERRTCGVTLAGTMSGPTEPAHGALRIFVSQALLRDLEPIATSALRKAIDDNLPEAFASTLRPKSIELRFRIGDASLHVEADVRLPDDTRARAQIEITFARTPTTDHRILERRGGARVGVTGPLADRARDVGGALGRALGAWLGKDAGRAIGESLGRDVATTALEGGLRVALEGVVDREVLPALSRAIAPPQSLDLGPEWDGARIALRFTTGPRSVRYVPDVGLTLSMDLLALAASRPAQRRSDFLADDPRRGWRSLRRPPPDLDATDAGVRGVVVDVSADFVNALLFGLWRAGHLDAVANRPALLAEWDARLADLTMRPAAIRFLRPPHVERAADNDAFDLVLADVALDLVPRRADARASRGAPLRAHAFVQQRLSYAYNSTTRALRLEGRVQRLQLTCRDASSPMRWTPCFADAVRLARDELRSRGPLLDLLRLPIDALNPLATPTDVGGSWLKLETADVEPRVRAGWIRMRVSARVSAATKP